MHCRKVLQHRKCFTVLFYPIRFPQTHSTGAVGSFPALNARPAAQVYLSTQPIFCFHLRLSDGQLDDWLAEITETLAAHNSKHPDCPAAPFAVNQIVHKSNARLEEDMAVCVKYDCVHLRVC
jgi:nitronate monooxygenase